MNDESASAKAKAFGYMTVFASFLAVFALFGYRATFAILKGPMSVDMGWSQAQVSIGYSLMMSFYAIAAFFSGWALDKWGTRPVYAIAAILGGLGFALTSLVHTHIAYLFTFGLVGGVATGMLWVSSTVSVRKWYVGKSYATMWGFAFAGGPLAQFILAYVTKGALDNFHGGGPDAWRPAMLLLGAIMFVLLGIAVFSSRKTPEKYGLEPFGQLPGAAAEKEWSTKEAFSKYAIWGAILVFLTSMMAEFLIWTQIVSFWVDDVGLTLGKATSVYAVIGIVGIVSMPLMGKIADKVVEKSPDEPTGRKIMLIVGPLLGAVACIILLVSGKSMLIAYIACFIFAFYWAIVPGGTVGYAGSVYGRKTLGKLWGLATLIVMGIGPFTGSFVGGLLRDISGSYMYSIYFALGSFVVSVLIALTLPLRAESEAEQKAREFELAHAKP